MGRFYEEVRYEKYQCDARDCAQPAVGEIKDIEHGHKHLCLIHFDRYYARYFPPTGTRLIAARRLHKQGNP